MGYEQRAHGKKYLVKWEGYPDSENTWEWEWFVENAQDRIQDFMKTNPTPMNPTRAQRRDAAQADELRRGTRQRRNRVRLVCALTGQEFVDSE